MTGWIQGANGVIAPVQAEAVLITTNDSYAIMEDLAAVKRLITQANEDAPDAAHTFIEITPREGGKAIINVAHIIGFVENSPVGAAG